MKTNDETLENLFQQQLLFELIDMCLRNDFNREAEALEQVLRLVSANRKARLIEPKLDILLH